LDGQGLEGIRIARELGTNAATVTAVRERLAQQEKQDEGVAA